MKKPQVETVDIDDIFASKTSKSKSKSKVVDLKQPIASSSKLPSTINSGSGSTGIENKKKKKKKRKDVYDDDDDVNLNESNLTKNDEKDKLKMNSKVEEILDPSVQPSSMSTTATIASTKRSDLNDDSSLNKKKRKVHNNQNNMDKVREEEDDELFKDSRGIGPRRKTEEGFLIYKEAELKIDPEAGGTPLCPFDCDCCF